MMVYFSNSSLAQFFFFSMLLVQLLPKQKSLSITEMENCPYCCKCKNQQVVEQCIHDDPML